VNFYYQKAISINPQIPVAGASTVRSAVRNKESLEITFFYGISAKTVE
jgi:hypothetical protein